MPPHRSRQGSFDNSPGELAWTPLILDKAGVKEFGQLSREFLEAVLELQTTSASGSPKAMAKGRQTFAVLLFVVERHPKHLTQSGLITEMSGERDEDKQLEAAISALVASGLLRENSGIIEPTGAALQATSILTL